MNAHNFQVIFCCPSEPGIGAPHHLMAAYWLASRGYDVHIFCRGEPGQGRVTAPLGGDITITKLGVSSLGYTTRLFRALVASRRRGKSVYFIVSHVSTPAAWLALAGVERQRVVYQTLDYIEPGRHPHWEFFERRLVRRAGRVISNESNRARFLASHYGLTQMPAVVPTLLPKAWPMPRRDVKFREAMLALVGRKDSERCRLVMHEGGYAAVRCGWQLVEAFRQLPDDFVLVFTGMTKGSQALAKLNEHVKQAGLVGRVIALAHLAYDDLLAHTASCDLGILLYPNDGVGNYYQCPGRLGHYIGCGLPVVASNFPGLELLVLKHKLGENCDPQSPQSIGEAISRLAGRDQAAQVAHGEALRLLAKSSLSYDVSASRIEEIVQGVSAITK